MKLRSTTTFLLTVIALGAVATLSGPAARAHATESRAWNRMPLPPAVNFPRSPVWEAIPGTNVSWVRESQRPDYDLFRYGSRYFIYDDGYWYRSDRLNRKFILIDERSVPRAFSGVPSHRWRSYPAGWMNPKNPHYSGRHDNGRSAAKQPDQGKDEGRGKNRR